MKKKNLILKYSGMLFFVIGIILTIRMYTENAWPTYLFFIMCIIGLIQIITVLFQGAGIIEECLYVTAICQAVKDSIIIVYLDS